MRLNFGYSKKFLVEMALQAAAASVAKEFELSDEQLNEGVEEFLAEMGKSIATSQDYQRTRS